MKSTLISARKPKAAPAPSFPALFQDNKTGDIALATSPLRGVIIHATRQLDGWVLGHAFDDSVQWDSSPRWTRLTTPVTIKFHP